MEWARKGGPQRHDHWRLLHTVLGSILRGEPGLLVTLKNQMKTLWDRRLWMMLVLYSPRLKDESGACILEYDGPFVVGTCD